MSKLTQTHARFIKMNRRSMRMTQSELAHASGTVRKTISRIENEQHSPSIDLLERIYKALGHELTPTPINTNDLD